MFQPWDGGTEEDWERIRLENRALIQEKEMDEFGKIVVYISWIGVAYYLSVALFTHF